jgi:hypothetical protein
MKRFPMPGLSSGQRKSLFAALTQRAALDARSREVFLTPEALSHTVTGQVWWALMMELQDRPLITVVGLLATSTYLVLWTYKQLHRFF